MGNICFGEGLCLGCSIIHIVPYDLYLCIELGSKLSHLIIITRNHPIHIIGDGLELLLHLSIVLLHLSIELLLLRALCGNAISLGLDQVRSSSLHIIELRLNLGSDVSEDSVLISNHLVIGLITRDQSLVIGCPCLSDEVLGILDERGNFAIHALLIRRDTILDALDDGCLLFHLIRLEAIIELLQIGLDSL